MTTTTAAITSVQMISAGVSGRTNSTMAAAITAIAARISDRLA